MLPPWWDQALSHLKTDSYLAAHIERYPGKGLRHRGSALITLINSLIGQQISVKAADVIRRRVFALVDPPTPERLLATTPEALRDAGLSKRKAEYLRNVATFFMENGIEDERFWETADYAKAKRLLLPVKGIGQWTVDMFAMFYLWESDVLPLSDLGIVKAINQGYGRGKTLSPKEQEAVAQPWRPYRSAACWLLWRSLDGEPLNY